jgi:biotin transport system substrate-specific component
MIQNLIKENSLNLAQKLIKIISGFILMFACSQIAIPLKPVPISLQTVGVMLIGLTYSRSEGMAAMLTYILAGAIGLPVFANFNSGLGGPTSGYFFGFIAAIYCMNKFKDRFGLQSFVSIVGACFVGTVITFVFGLAWLSSLIGFSAAITHGLMPFIIPGIVKVLILSASLKAVGFKVNRDLVS